MSGKCLGKQKASWLVMFAKFCDATTPTVADSKLPAGRRWTRRWDERNAMGLAPQNWAARD